MIQNYKIVTLCGSTRFKDQFLETQKRLTLERCPAEGENVPAWIDYWGYDSAHDWAWWRKQIVYFMDHLLTEETVEYVI